MTADEGLRLHEVVLPDVATELFLAYLEHLDGLLHEVKLLDAGTTAGVTCVGPDLADLIEAIVASHADAFGTAREQAAAAQHHHHPAFDLTVALPATAGGAAAGLIALLDRADELADQGRLLTLAAPPAIRELRHQLRDQIVSSSHRPQNIAAPALREASSSVETPRRRLNAASPAAPIFGRLGEWEDADGEQRDVVACLGCQSLDQSVTQLLGREPVQCGSDRAQLFQPVIEVAASAFDEPVRVENKRRAWDQCHLMVCARRL